MTNKRIVFIAVLALSTALSAFAQGETFERGQRNRLDNRWGFVQNNGDISLAPRVENGLSEEQKAAIKEIKIQGEKEAKPLKYKLNELKARQQTLINEDKPDMKAINSNIDEMTKIKNQLAKIKAKERVEVLSKLTEEQKLLFSERKRGKGIGKGSRFGGDRMSRRAICPMI